MSANVQNREAKKGVEEGMNGKKYRRQQTNARGEKVVAFFIFNHS